MDLIDKSNQKNSILFLFLRPSLSFLILRTPSLHQLTVARLYSSQPQHHVHPKHSRTTCPTTDGTTLASQPRKSSEPLPLKLLSTFKSELHYPIHSQVHQLPTITQLTTISHICTSQISSHSPQSATVKTKLSYHYPT